MSLSKHLQPTEHKRPSYAVDPRADLTEDHELWEKLLQLALDKHGEDLAGVLHGFRCGGTRLRQGKHGYVLRPDIDPAGKVAWQNVDEYEHLKNKYLEPWRNEVAVLLKELS